VTAESFAFWMIGFERGSRTGFGPRAPPALSRRCWRRNFSEGVVASALLGRRKPGEDEAAPSVCPAGAPPGPIASGR